MGNSHPSPDEPPGPTIGEQSRRYLREREQKLTPDPNPPAYRVPAVPQRPRPAFTAANGLIVAHFVLGAIWCMLGAATILAILGDGSRPAAWEPLLGLGIMVYGGLCIATAIGLWIGARWAWPTAIVLAIGWLLILVYESLMAAQISLALLIPAWMIWALWRHRVRFREPH
jgi:hypothetical protein